MISLTYMSTATKPFGSEELAALLSTSRTNNHAADLTGMLLYVDGHFIQTLEGPQEQVDAVFSRIETNPQHRDILVALREDIDARAFPDWSMGFETLSVEDAEALPGFNDYLAGDHPSPEARRDLGRAGIFHRIFRDRLR